MDDLTLTKLCAEAMGYVESRDGLWNNGWYNGGYKLDRNWNPLHDDAQAMALMKAFHLNTSFIGVTDSMQWGCLDETLTNEAYGPDLNRCICECVANLTALRQRGR